MLGTVDAAAALADLPDISPQIRRVVVVDAAGGVVGSNAPDDLVAARLAEQLPDGVRDRPDISPARLRTGQVPNGPGRVPQP